MLPRSHTLLTLATTILLAACGSAQQETGLGPVPPGVIVDLQDTTYPVAGTTAEEILQDLRASGPGGRWFRYRWRLRWAYRYGEVEIPSIGGGRGETVCELNDIRLTLTFERVLPEWTPGAEADPELAAQWETFMRAVRVHGEGHRDIAVETTREILRRLRELQTPNCAFIQREARGLYDDLAERNQERDREYEAETEGGRTQGVVWPPQG